MARPLVGAALIMKEDKWCAIYKECFWDLLDKEKQLDLCKK
jgi:hypothetical protein